MTPARMKADPAPDLATAAALMSTHLPTFTSSAVSRRTRAEPLHPGMLPAQMALCPLKSFRSQSATTERLRG